MTPIRSGRPCPSMALHGGSCSSHLPLMQQGLHHMRSRRTFPCPRLWQKLLTAACGGGSMPTYLSPGVYVEEVSSGSRPIEGVGTAFAAFVGIPSGAVQRADARHELDPVHEHLRRVRRGRLPAACRLRLLPQRGRRGYIVRIGQDGSAAGTGTSAPRRACQRPAASRAGRVAALDPARGLGKIPVEVAEPAGTSGGGVQAAGQATVRSSRSSTRRPPSAASSTW